MTEEEWNACTDPMPMLESLQGKCSDRKLRLFAVACCRRIWNLMTDNRSRHAVVLAERWADETVRPEEVAKAKEAAWAVVMDDSSCETCSAAWDALNWPVPWDAACRAADAAASEAVWAVAPIPENGEEENDPDREAAYNALEAVEKAKQAALLRHIIGNPFKPDPGQSSWPSTVVQLAESLYQGQDCRLPLSDVLEESGHLELAEHFRQEEGHPKGCWVLDLLLGKK
jgi:hypothetical protein